MTQIYHRRKEEQGRSYAILLWSEDGNVVLPERESAGSSKSSFVVLLAVSAIQANTILSVFFLPNQTGFYPMKQDIIVHNIRLIDNHIVKISTI